MSPAAAFVERSIAGAGDVLDVERVGSAAGAVERLAADTFDVLLLDLGLPDAAGAIAAVQAASPTTAVVVVGRADDEAAALEAVRAGAQDCLDRHCLALGCGAAAVVLRRALRHAVERKRAEDRIAFLAEHDPLTGLHNRAVFRSALERALARARRREERLAVLFLDLDGFKRVNDRYGHAAGDRLLELIAQRLQSSLREQDIVARLGGDEFLVLIEGVRAPEAAIVVARHLRDALARRFALGAHRVRCAASIGIAVSPPHGLIEPDALIARADAAMYRAKAARAGYELAPQPAAELSG
jgi:diguanylate cyclase (GGDEF)-like protein